MKRLQQLLFHPVDIAFLVYFRVFSGGFIAGEMINQLFTEDYLNYIEPAFHFTYQFFPWVTALPATGMYLLFAVIIFSALCVAVGWKYRFTSAVLFFSYTAMFLMEKSEYVNHFYLYCLLTFFLMLLPAHRALSIDSWKKPQKMLSAVPAWMYYLLIFQMGVVYFYAGIAKLHGDWWEASAMTLWMAAKGDIPVVGPLLIHPLTPKILSYSGLLFDLLIVPAMLWRKTRLTAFFIACFFHMSNVIMFGLATFPWFSLMMTALYFGPAWPRKLPFFGRYLPAYIEGKISMPPVGNRKAVVAALLIYAFFQLTIPFRHFLYPYSPNWTEEGHRFSWHMMLRSKYSQTLFRVKADGEKFVLDGEEYLTLHQLRKMGGDPDMILEFARFLKSVYEKKGYEKVEVYALAMVSLNGRPLQPLIDPGVNLAEEKRSLCHYPWIMPLRE